MVTGHKSKIRARIDRVIFSNYRNIRYALSWTTGIIATISAIILAAYITRWLGNAGIDKMAVNYIISWYGPANTLSFFALLLSEVIIMLAEIVISILPVLILVLIRMNLMDRFDHHYG